MNYKKFYESYHGDRRLPKRIITNKNFTYRIALEILDKYCKSNDVLDIGSGVGTVDLYLAKKGKNVTGIDISENAVNIAEKSSKLFGLENKVLFRRIDLYKLKPDKKYNFVMCTEVLEHLPNDKKAIEKISKLTKRGGLLFLTVPSKDAPLNKFEASKDHDKHSGHLRRYSIEILKTILEENGFKIIFSKKAVGIITRVLYAFELDQIIRIANRFALISDLLISFDNFSLKFFRESDLMVIARRV